MITLRILTRKSKLGVGPYANETVQKLLDRKMYPMLRRYYYTYEAISFQDDILDEIHAEIRIEKPGTDKSAIEILDERMAMRQIKKLNMIGERKAAMGAYSSYKASVRHKKRIGDRNTKNKERLTKGILQAANHGHIIIMAERYNQD